MFPSTLLGPNSQPTITRAKPVVVVSVIIINWNSADLLPRCLASLAAQTYNDFEVIVVDNGSTDDSVADVSSRFPTLNLRVERLASNRGFAAANNIGASLARGKWLALLNQDAFPQSDWLERLLEATQRHPESSFFASRLIQANCPVRLDGAGDTYHISGMAWRRHHGDAIDAALQEEEVFSACAAAALCPRDQFLRLGGFDEDYFSYHEDVDLGFRFRLLGLRCLYVPQAMVYHVGASGSGNRNDLMIYYGHRNMVWTYVKNMPTSLLWLYLPAHFMVNLFYAIVFSIRGHGRTIWRAKVDALRGMRAVLRKRHELQRMRRASITDLRRVMNQCWMEPYRRAWRHR